MLRLGFAVAIALAATNTVAATFPSPPLYPSFSSPRAKIKTIEPTTAVQSSATAIVASGEIAGYYFDNSIGAEHGFIREANGNYITVDAPDAGESKGSGTAISSLSPVGVAVGNYFDSGGTRHGFVRAASGTITEFDPTGSTGTLPTHINEKGEIAGWFYKGTDSTTRASFVRGVGGKITTFSLKEGNPLDTTAECINASGIIAGEYYSNANRPHGFVRGAEGKLTKFDPPGSVKTYVYGINATNSIVGTFADSSGVLHGYIRVAGGAITVIDAPGSGTKAGEGTVLQGINNSNATAGFYLDGTNASHAFLRGAGGALTTFEISGAQSVSSSSIDNSRALVGTYVESNIAHGFLRKP